MKKIYFALFIKTKDDYIITIQIYVDDIIFGTSNELLYEILKK